MIFAVGSQKTATVLHPSKNRYNSLGNQFLQDFIQQAIQNAHEELIQQKQLKQLADVLRFPTDREAPSGMY
jgi:hypothetical protein